MENRLTRRKFYTLMWKVYAQDKSAFLAVVKEDDYYNVRVFWNGTSQYIAGPEYTYSKAMAEETMEKFTKLTRGML